MRIKIFVGIALLLFFIITTSLISAGFILYQLKKETGSFSLEGLKSGSGGSDAGEQDLAFLTVDVVAQHATAQDCWIIIENDIYAVTKYLDAHPGGAEIVVKYCGKDATSAFQTKEKNPPVNHSQTALGLLKNYYIGTLGQQLADTQLTNQAATGSAMKSGSNLVTTALKPITTTAQNPSQVVASVSLTPSEIATHNTLQNCWLIISGKVYDVTSFIVSHPGGTASITPYCGKDGTQAFATKDKNPGSNHSQSAYNMLANYLIGSVGSTVAVAKVNPPVAVTPPAPPAPMPPGNQPPAQPPNSNLTLTPSEIATHNTLQNCWLIISGKVYDVTGYIVSHPGGKQAIIDYCGKDGTAAFQTKGNKGKDHSNSAYSLLNNYLIGSVGSSVPVVPGPSTAPAQNTPPPEKSPRPENSSCPQGVLPPAVAGKYPGATIIQQKIGGTCKQELKIDYNGECRKIHTDAAGNIKEDEKC